MTAAPILAVAELHRRLSGSGTRPEGGLDSGRVRRGVRWFIGRVLGRTHAESLEWWADLDGLNSDAAPQVIPPRATAAPQTRMATGFMTLLLY